MASYAAHSRVDWASTNEKEYPGDFKMVIGCLQRIADATEKMASNYTQLQNDLDRYKGYVKANREEVHSLERRLSAYKGVITKLKKK